MRFDTRIDRRAQCAQPPPIRGCGSPKRSKRGCGARAHGALAADATLEDIVAAYQCRCAPAHDEELGSFRAEPSLRAAVERAALAQRPDGKRYAHQRRIGRGVLPECRSRLTACCRRLAGAHDFAALYARVRHAIADIPGVGPLLVYDTALRIGAKLRLEPDRIYLHCGTRAGARALGLPWKEPSLAPDDVPRVLRDALSPDQIENFLCIYRARLARMRRTAP